jgi:CO dehydrogenase/acetyl-CoA synthase gamma subunit (corrinoid Fe-S protein)
MYNKTDFLKVYFTKQIDRENRNIEVWILSPDSDSPAEDILLAHGQLNLCSNMAHIQILEKHRYKKLKWLNDVSNFDIERAIEEREILGNRILIK